MRTAVITAKHQIELLDAPTPELQPDEVLIRVAASGICGSDVHLFNDAHPFRKPPMIPGHEIAGEVVAVGSHVKGHRPGNRVVVNHAIPCGSCPQCKQGDINICGTKIVAGSAKMMGFFAEYVNVPESTLFPIGEEISYQDACLAEPLSIGFHILRRLQLADKGPIAIVGTGTIGLVTLIAARYKGYREIYCTDPLDYNLEVAAKLGATKTFNPTKVDAVEEIRSCTGGQGAAATVLTANARGIITQASAMTKMKGAIALVPMTNEIMEASFYRLITCEQALIGVRGIVRQDFADAVDLINSGFDMTPLITHVMPMSQSQNAFELMNARSDPVIKILVQPDR